MIRIEFGIPMSLRYTPWSFHWKLKAENYETNPFMGNFNKWFSFGALLPGKLLREFFLLAVANAVLNSV